MSDTRQNIMRHAELLVRTKGANGFSYADLATQLDIRKASIHYHFPSKKDLLLNLIQSYHAQHMEILSELDSMTRPRDKLYAFVDIYKQGLKIDALCLCGMLTLDSSALTARMREELEKFFEDSEGWLTAVFQAGHSQGEWQLSTQPGVEAQVLLALVQGAQLLARNAPSGEEKFECIVKEQLDKYIIDSKKEH